MNTLHIKMVIKIINYKLRDRLIILIKKNNDRHINSNLKNYKKKLLKLIRKVHWYLKNNHLLK